MREYQERKKIRKILHSNLFLGGICIVFVILSISAVKMFFRGMKAIVKNRETMKELEDLKRKKEILEEGLVRLKTQAGVEEEIRKKFNVAKPGEEVLVIVDKDKENAKINGDIEQRGFFSRIWNWMAR